MSGKSGVGGKEMYCDSTTLFRPIYIDTTVQVIHFYSLTVSTEEHMGVYKERWQAELLEMLLGGS